MSTHRETIQITAAPDTDIWRKPPSTDRFNAPYSTQVSCALGQFLSARVSFAGPWEHQYDQAGLLIYFPNGSGQGSDSSPPSWIKAGVEFYKGSPKISFVGCDRYADWSLHDLKPSPDDDKTVTIELRREGDENGFALWAYQLTLDKQGQVLQRHPIRECTFVYARDESDKVEIGPYVARPFKQGLQESDLLKVTFQNFVVTCRD